MASTIVLLKIDQDMTLGKEGFKWWNTLPTSKDEENQKNLEAVIKAIADTLEVSTPYWNSDIRQGEHETTN